MRLVTCADAIGTEKHMDRFHVFITVIGRFGTPVPLI